MDWDKSNFPISPIRFEATYVSRHLDLLMARLKRHDDDRALAEFAGVPAQNLGPLLSDQVVASRSLALTKAL